MSVQAHDIEYNAPQSVTTISANARVDYILRFSKHAVLVVDQDANVYSQVASQFLGSLATDHNAAFIAISPKLNDIQIRCRIVEQLFADTLFDPEQSLAVSLINLAKQEKHAIDIVIEHAQFLTVQILHELCQLTDIAKKANYAISVLMLGTPQTGLVLANNKSLFHKKISVLSGETGQLLPLNAKVFKTSKPLFEFTRFTKWMMVFISFVICLGLTGYWLFQQDAFSLKTKLSLQAAIPNSTNIVSAYKEQNISPSAKTEDIFLSLTAPEQQVKEIKNVAAQPADIIQAIVSFEQSTVKLIEQKRISQTNRFDSFLDKKPVIQDDIAVAFKSEIVELDIIQAITSESNTAQSSVEPLTQAAVVETKGNANSIESVGDEASYYTSAQIGFVIQISGFTRLPAYQKFLPDFEGMNIKSYYRLFNQQTMLMITSEAFQTRLAAEQAVALLPSAIKAYQPWIKSVEAINNEINAYQRSQ
jgi:DamX protein